MSWWSQDSATAPPTFPMVRRSPCWIIIYATSNCLTSKHMCIGCLDLSPLGQIDHSKRRDRMDQCRLSQSCISGLYRDSPASTNHIEFQGQLTFYRDPACEWCDCDSRERTHIRRWRNSRQVRLYFYLQFPTWDLVSCFPNSFKKTNIFNTPNKSKQDLLRFGEP